MGIITLYEGNNATQNLVETYSDNAHSGKVSPNDEARSLMLNNVRVGCTIVIYDSPDASTNDDFCVIDVKKDAEQYVVASFEKTYTDDVVQVTYVRNNGLDGKVSYIRIQ